MYIDKEASFRGVQEHWESDDVPLDLTLLYRREREIALIVYERGLATAADVQVELADDLSNPAIRSMLNRLVNKGILTRVKCGRHGTFVYAPAITQASARETALRQFARDFYAGSLTSLAAAIAEMFASGAQPSDRAVRHA